MHDLLESITSNEKFCQERYEIFMIVLKTKGYFEDSKI